MPSKLRLAAGVATAVAACAAGAVAVGSATVPAQAPPAGIRGTIVEDHTGAPLAGVTLRLHAAGRKAALREITTDADGRFAAADLPAGEYRVEIEQPNHLPVTARVQTSLAADLSIHLVRRGVVSGRLVAPAIGTLLLIERVPEGAAARQMRVRPGAAGDFRFWDVPIGRYALVVLNPTIDGRLHRGLVPVEPGARGDLIVNGGESYEDLQVLVPPVPVASVTARVVSLERDIQGAVAVRLVPAEWPVAPVVTRIVRDDVFRADDVLPGTYDLVAAEDVRGIGPEGELRGRERITVAGADVDVEIPMRVFTGEPYGGPATDDEPGVLEGAIDAAGAPAVVVVVLIEVTPGRAAPMRAAFARPGDDVRFDEVPPGRYYVAARDASRHDARWAPEPGRPPENVQVLPGVRTKVTFTW
jgi:5-hydroxyisourate hydrolase-like protein (transthyretin family)